jgi:rod shape-determining protein MreD
MIRSYSKQRMFLVLGVALLLEALNVPFAYRNFFKIDFFLIFLVFHAFYIHRENTLMAAIGLGLLEDVFSNSMFGVGMFAFGQSGILHGNY